MLHTMLLIIPLNSSLQDIPHSQPPVSIPLPSNLYFVPTVPVHAELVEPYQLVNGFGFSIYLSFLPLAVCCLCGEGRKHEAARDGDSGTGDCVLIPDQ